MEIANQHLYSILRFGLEFFGCQLTFPVQLASWREYKAKLNTEPATRLVRTEKLYVMAYRWNSYMTKDPLRKLTHGLVTRWSSAFFV